MARRKVPLAVVREGGGLLAAALCGVRAAGVEAAAGGDCERARHVALEDQVPPRAVGSRQRNGREQRLGIGVARSCEEGGLGGELDDLAEVHDRDAMGDVLHHREVVGDEDEAEPETGLQILEQVDDLCAHRDVEGRDGLVADQELGLDRKGAGDADALALAARELVRVAPRVAGQQAHEAEELGHPLLFRAAAGEAVNGERLGQHLADRHARVERAVGVLEDDLHLAAQAPHALARECQDIAPLEPDRPAVGIDEAQHQPAGRGFPAPALAHERERLAGREGEVDAVDRLDRAAGPSEKTLLEPEVLDQPLDLEERRQRRREVLEPCLASPSSAVPEGGLETGGEMARAERAQRGLDRAALRIHEGAARMEGAARRQGREVRHRTLDGGEPRLVVAELRQGAEEPDRIGMLRLVEEGRDRGLLDDSPCVHDGDLVGDLGDDAQVVADHDDRRAELGMELAHEVEDLGLDGDVEGGGRLVGDEKLGTAGERHGDHHALAHPARELVGIVVVALFRGRDAHAAHHLYRALPRLAAADPLVALDRLGDLLADGEGGVQGGHRLLEDHRDVVAAQLAHLGGREPSEILAFEDHLPARNAPGRYRHKPHDGECRHTLAAAGLAHEAEGAPGPECEAHPVDGPGVALRTGEMDLEAAHLEERFRRQPARFLSRQRCLGHSRSAFERCLAPLELGVDHGTVVHPGGVGPARQEGEEGLEDLLAHLVEAAELDERLGVIVDPKIEAGVGLRRVDAEGGRLLAALVPAGGLPGIEGREQAEG